MSNYTRQSSFSDGDVITSALFNNEYNQLLNAFAYASSGTTGHQHDGGAGEGGNIHTIGDQNFLNKIVVDSTNNRWGFFVEVSSSTVEQIRLQDGALVPVTDNDIDLGTSSLEFKDGYFDGTVYADAINFNGTAITATAAELNIMDGVTSTAAELNILDGVTASATDINLIDGITNGTVIASKVIITDANKDISGGRNITISGELDAATLDISGDADIDGTTNLDAVDIDGTVQIDGVTTFGVDDTGVDVKFFGATSGAYLLWDESADKLLTAGATTIDIVKDKLLIGSTAVTTTAAELNILDGVTSTTAELNILDGVTSTAAELNILDGVTSTAAELNILDGVTSTASELNVLDGITAVVGELNALDIGATAVGTAVASKAVILDSNKDYSGIRNLTISGELDAATGDFSGDVDIDGTLEADAITINGTSLAETISDTVGAMVGSNTETGITVTYEDGDNTLDFALGAAQTTITSLLATDIKIGEDDQTKIDFETADEIHFYAANAHQIKLVDGALVPVTDNDIDLGTSSLEFKDAYFDGTVTADAFAGPLTGNVTGTADVATVATTVTITDNESTNESNALIFAAGGDVDGGNLGLESDGTLTYNPSTGIVTATGFAGALTGNVTGNVSGTAATVTGAAQSSITSLGTLTTLTVDNVVINGATIGHGDDTDLMTVADGVLTVAGEVSMTTLDIGGTNVTSTAAELNILDGVTSTAAELNILDGVTSTAAELNILDGVTSTTAELNILDGVTSTAAELNILDGVTSTAAELNILDGVTSTAAELNYLDITTLGTTQASKAVTTDSNGDVVFPDGDKINLGTGSDLQLFHDGSDSYVKDAGTGRLVVETDGTDISLKAGSDNMLVAAKDGAVTLYYDNAAKLATASGGVNITGELQLSTHLDMTDSGIIKLGSDDDLSIKHDGSNGSIVNSTGDLYISDAGGNIYIQAKTGEQSIVAFADGAVDLYHNNAKKLETTATGITVTGAITVGQINASSGSKIYTAGSGTYELDIAGALTLSSGRDNGASMLFEVSNSEKMRIEANGRVGIGLTSPSYDLHVKGSVGIQGADDANEGGQIDFVGGTSYTGYGKQIDLYQQDFRFFGPNSWNASFFSTTGGATASISASGSVTGNNLVIADGSNIGSASNSNTFTITANSHDDPHLAIDGITNVNSPTNTGAGVWALQANNLKTDNSTASNVMRVRLANLNPSDGNHMFQCVSSDGTARFFVQNNGTRGGTSDGTLKENIVDATDKLAELRQLKVRNYNWIEHGPEGGFKELGFIAQEVETIFPKMVRANPETGKKMLLDDVFVPILVKSLQEAADKIDALETRIAALEG